MPTGWILISGPLTRIREFGLWQVRPTSSAFTNSVAVRGHRRSYACRFGRSDVARKFSGQVAIIVARLGCLAAGTSLDPPTSEFRPHFPIFEGVITGEF